MTKGTPSFGKHQTTTHIRCRRCGKYAYNKRTGICASCGYGKSPKMNKEKWRTKTRSGKRSR
ncbi:MAG: 50S ribosomal protein L37e [Candidatus Aenigmarchaeota archaeon]|nr:50S ribosomal protein L37e [Candidatus Aenigmarchaeota archaeon]